MNEKYFVFVDVRVIGMKYDPKSKKIMVGGNIRFKGIMEILLGDYFNSEIPRPSYTAYNKMKFETKINGKVWEAGKEKLKEDNITLQYTTKFRRLMR